MSFRSNFARCRWANGEDHMWLHGVSEPEHLASKAKIYVGVAAPETYAFDLTVYEADSTSDWEIKLPVPNALKNDPSGTLWAVGFAIVPGEAPIMWAESFRRSLDNLVGPEVPVGPDRPLPEIE
jgi:hypothetical protein